MGLGQEIEGRLREFAAAGPVEVREGGARLAPLSALSWEVRGQSNSPLIHLWSEKHNLTRRVLSIAESGGQRLVLSVQRFGRSKPDRLEFLRTDFERTARALGRDEFRDWLAHLVAQQFPDETLESLAIASDLEHSLSGNYARGILRRGKARWALLGLPESETPGTEEDALTFALLWLERVRQTNRRGAVAGLRLILPRAALSAIAHRLGALDPGLAVELYECDATRETLERVDARKAGNLATWLVPRREAESLLALARPAVDEILARVPAVVTLHASPESHEVFLRFRGLTFARWEEGRIFFGSGDPREELTPASRPAFDKLLRDLELYRHPLASDTRHALYRAQPERWLESLVRSDIARVDAALDPQFAYAQVFASAGGNHGVIDLLGVTRSGRLAVLELKAGEHIHLPLQAADYWLRVRRHQLQGDFSRYGYFPGVELQPAPPLVYLVAPAIRFHPSTDALLRNLSPEIEVVRVGLTEAWRRGIQVVLRQC